MKNEHVSSNVKNIPVRILYYPLNLVHGTPARVIAPMHFHDEVEFVYVDHGRILFTVNDDEFIAEPGDLVYVAGRVPHETRALVENTNTALIQFSLRDFMDIRSDISRYLYRFISVGGKSYYHFVRGDAATENVLSHIRMLCTESTTHDAGYESFVKSGIYALVGTLYRMDLIVDAESFFNRKYLDRLHTSLAYIDTHYAEPITLDVLSEVSRLNASYFCRLFKKTTHATFTEYLNFVRVCKSEQMLTSMTASVSAVSAEVGFSSVSYFSRVFKHYKGCSPGRYQKILYDRQQ